MTDIDPTISLAVRQVLGRLLAEQGEAVIDAPKRLEALLRDLCPGHQREIWLLVQAAGTGTPQALPRGRPVTDLEAVLRRQSQQLFHRYGTDRALARWAVESWALALGHSVDESRPITAPAEPAQTDATPRAGSAVSSSRSDDPLFTALALRESDWVPIPAGTFLMGSPEDEAGRSRDEREHRVHVFIPFALLCTPVTFAMYDTYCAATGRERPDDEGWGRGRRPVINVSYWDAVDYAAWLSAQTGWRCRLPTEAEWEYACRAPWGDYPIGGPFSPPFSTGATITTDQANYDGNFPYGDGPLGVFCEQTTAVDQFPRNRWNLHDMHGNVWEWCASVYDKDYSGLEQENASGDRDDDRDRVLRGGSWWSPARDLRSARRYWSLPVLRSVGWGFRLARI